MGGGLGEASNTNYIHTLSDPSGLHPWMNWVLFLIGVARGRKKIAHCSTNSITVENPHRLFCSEQKVPSCRDRRQPTVTAWIGDQRSCAPRRGRREGGVIELFVVCQRQRRRRNGKKPLGAVCRPDFPAWNYAFLSPLCSLGVWSSSSALLSHCYILDKSAWNLFSRNKLKTYFVFFSNSDHHLQPNNTAHIERDRNDHTFTMTHIVVANLEKWLPQWLWNVLQPCSPLVAPMNFKELNLNIY